MQKARSHPEGLLPLVSVWFQGLFHSVVHGSFHLSFTVLVRYRSLKSIQPYQMVLVTSHRITHVPRYSGYYQNNKIFRVRGYHPLWHHFPESFHQILLFILQSYNPKLAEKSLVRAIPVSLAATQGITIVFSSTRYLDVSVPWVCFISCDMISCLQHDGFPHSEIYGSMDICSSPQLIAAYHVLHRP